MIFSSKFLNVSVSIAKSGQTDPLFSAETDPLFSVESDPLFSEETDPLFLV
jgi:hypothetical protein